MMEYCDKCGFIKPHKGNGVYGIVTAQEAHYAMGWNGCLDELLDSN